MKILFCRAFMIVLSSVGAAIGSAEAASGMYAEQSTLAPDIQLANQWTQDFFNSILRLDNGKYIFPHARQLRSEPWYVNGHPCTLYHTIAHSGLVADFIVKIG
ncbi:MAG: hypothetical protein NC924_03110 [Candidatus Omnitrophica bacterium]|nr:hypothetical protein [Candidatus Omnitrophota bacterium]